MYLSAIAGLYRTVKLHTDTSISNFFATFDTEGAAAKQSSGKKVLLTHSELVGLVQNLEVVIDYNMKLDADVSDRLIQLGLSIPFRPVFPRQPKQEAIFKLQTLYILGPSHQHNTMSRYEWNSDVIDLVIGGILRLSEARHVAIVHPGQSGENTPSFSTAIAAWDQKILQSIDWPSNILEGLQLPMHLPLSSKLRIIGRETNSVSSFTSYSNYPWDRVLGNIFRIPYDRLAGSQGPVILFYGTPKSVKKELQVLYLRSIKFKGRQEPAVLDRIRGRLAFLSRAPFDSPEAWRNWLTKDFWGEGISAGTVAKGRSPVLSADSSLPFTFEASLGTEIPILEKWSGILHSRIMCTAFITGSSSSVWLL